MRIASSPRLDGIDYRILKEMPIEIKKEMTRIFNGLIQRNEIPEDWRKYQCIFIDKGTKKKVRPISLSSCVGKLLERIVNERLNWWIEKNDIIDKTQNGFRRGKSCGENLTQIVAIRKGLFEGESTIAVFLDVKGAYDNVSYKVMLKKLEEIECLKLIKNFVTKWMEYREVKFINNMGGKVIIMVGKGLPQGVVLLVLCCTPYTREM